MFAPTSIQSLFATLTNFACEKYAFSIFEEQNKNSMSIKFTENNS